MHKMPLLRQVLSQFVLLSIALYVLVPIWGTARLAFDGALTSRPTEFHFFPKEFSLNAFEKVLDKPYQNVAFTTLLGNSLTASLGAAGLALALGLSLAYAFARFRFPGRQAGLFVLLLTALLPPVAFMTPLYIILSLLKIRTTLMALVIVYAAFAMPFCIWNMRAAFQAVPKELEEAAYLDGAGDFTTFWRISLPLALPSLAVSALIAFLMGYSEFALGWLFVERPDTVTLSMTIYTMINAQFGSALPWSHIGALSLIMSIPVVVVFIIFQNTIFDSLLFGNAND
jgi:arabinogalactan oligomer/maltooligosaccharide transport system permease protein